MFAVLLSRAVMVIAAFGVAFLALRTTMVELLPAHTLAGNALAGDDARIFNTIAEQAIATGPVADLIPRSRKAANQQPLAEQPFLLAASAAVRDGQLDRAESLLNQALQRNPRSRQARLMLLESYGRRVDVTAMAKQLVILSRLSPNAHELVIATVAQLVVDPQTRSATLQALRGNPVVEPVLGHLAATSADPDAVLALSRVATASGALEQRDWQARLIANLVDAGDFRRAVALWREFTPGAGDKGGAALYNPDFQDLPGVPPFNWKLATGGIGAAERAQDGALEVTYFGRDSGSLASQLLLLPPGTYELSVRSAGAAPAEAGEIAWTVSCAGIETVLTTLRLPDASDRAQLIESSFTVPPTGCSAQWLKLVGIAKEFPRTRSARMTGLSLVKSGV